MEGDPQNSLTQVFVNSESTQLPNKCYCIIANNLFHYVKLNHQSCNLTFGLMVITIIMSSTLFVLRESVPSHIIPIHLFCTPSGLRMVSELQDHYTFNIICLLNLFLFRISYVKS